MELYIHFGIYKTGSSFLQTACALNRPLLKEHSFYFPESEREADMRSGRISPGNGNGLVEILKTNNIDACRSLLQKWITAAQANSCTKILISSEALIHAFAKPECAAALQKAAQEVKLDQIKTLGFFRDPVDHAMSTFKHRAKKGRLTNFDEWIERNYETPEVLEAFIKNYKHYQHFACTLRRYRKNTEFMLKAFFEDWLGIPGVIAPEQRRVNESLTLSEIKLIELAAKHKPQLAFLFTKGFTKLSSDEKAKGGGLEISYRRKTALYLTKTDHVWKLINKSLPKHEHLQLPSDVLPTLEGKEDRTLHLSEVQMDIFLKTWIKSESLMERFKQVGRRIKKMVKP